MADARGPAPMSRSRLSLRPTEAAQLLWIRSLEEADLSGAVISAAARTAASRSADAPDDADFLKKRTAALTNQLPTTIQVPPGPGPGASWAQRLPSWTPWAVIAASFLIGIAGNSLGPAHLINILSFPLLGLILWNLCVCAISLFTSWKSRRRSTAAATPPPRVPGGDAVTTATAAWQRQHAEWEKPRTHARMAITFHAAAIALAAGVVAGMYLHGLAKSYTVEWGSTFLSESHVRSITRAILGPASLLTGIPVPEPGTQSLLTGIPVSEPRAHSSAAPWIHLWAASAFLFIVIPRMLLMNMARRRAAQYLPDYAAEFAPWLAVCRSMTKDHSTRAEVVTLHFEPDTRARDAVRALIQQRWGAHVGAEFHPPLQYGSEQLPAVTAPPQFLVVVVNFSATPETEVHGAILRTLASTTPSPERRLLVLDATAFTSRFRTLPEFADRLRARRTAWEKAAGDFPIHLHEDGTRRA